MSEKEGCRSLGVPSERQPMPMRRASIGYHLFLPLRNPGFKSHWRQNILLLLEIIIKSLSLFTSGGYFPESSRWGKNIFWRDWLNTLLSERMIKIPSLEANGLFSQIKKQLCNTNMLYALITTSS